MKVLLLLSSLPRLSLSGFCFQSTTLPTATPIRGPTFRIRIFGRHQIYRKHSSSLSRFEVAMVQRDGNARTGCRTSFDVFPYGTKVTDRPTKVVHFLRHAEGTHNVNKDYRSRTNIDAQLTEKGIRQCQDLAKQIAEASEGPLYDLREKADLIVTSPLQRCIQTATLSLQPLLLSQQRERPLPMVAHEMVRETVNYNCDRRRNIQALQDEHTHVDFTHMTDERDAIWQNYEDRFGCDETFTKHRESGEIHVVADRGRAFFQWLHETYPHHSHVVVCTHSAFLRCIKNFGNNPDKGPLGVPLLPEQHDELPDRIIPVLQYSLNDGKNGKTDDNKFAQEMKSDYANCELRSMVIGF